MSICEHLEDRFLTKSTTQSANSLKVLTVVTAAWEFTIAEKSKISAPFLRVDVTDWVGLKNFNNCDLLPLYIYCFFVKH